MLFPSLLPLAMVGWMSATPAAPPKAVLDATVAASHQDPAAPTEDQPVEVTLFDVNHQEQRTVVIGRDGKVDAETRTTLERMFRCKRTQRRHEVDTGLLVMLADVSAHYPGQTIEYISAFRAVDGHTSRHRQGRALDFRIPGVDTIELRDYLWTHHSRLGLGWYPEGDFVHMDHRDDPDYAWTHIGNHDRGNPGWAAELRKPKHADRRVNRVGT